jgi:hypothetical protein
VTHFPSSFFNCTPVTSLPLQLPHFPSSGSLPVKLLQFHSSCFTSTPASSLPLQWLTSCQAASIPLQLPHFHSTCLIPHSSYLTFSPAVSNVRQFILTTTVKRLALSMVRMFLCQLFYTEVSNFNVPKTRYPPPPRQTPVQETAILPETKVVSWGLVG